MKNIKLMKPEIQRLYLDGLEPGDILKRFPGLASSTLYTWIKKYKWDELKATKIIQYNNMPAILNDSLMKMMENLKENLLDDVKVARIVDSITKIMKSIKTLFKEKDRFGSIIFTLGELGKYMRDCEESHLFDEEFRNKFDKLLSGFQQLMLDKYSPKNQS